MTVTPAAAQAVGDALGVDWAAVSPADWRAGLEVELEHGSRLGPATNVTGDDLTKTGRIALAHLIEDPYYYRRLEKMEAEADAYWATRPKPSAVLARPGPSATLVLLTALLVVLVVVLLVVLWAKSPRYNSFAARYST